MRRAGILDHAGDARVADAVMVDHGSSTGLVRLDGRPRRERLVPCGELRMPVAPGQLGKAEIDVAERDADRDVADREARGRERVGLLSSSMSTETLVFSFHACMCLIDCCAGRAQLLAAPHQHRVEHAVAERLAAQRHEPLGKFFRKQLLAAVQRVEILADHRASRRSRCRRRAAGSAAGSADFPSSARCSASRPPPRCARSRCGRQGRTRAPRSSPCAHRASAATSAAAFLLSLRFLCPPRSLASIAGAGKREAFHGTSRLSTWPSGSSRC